MNAVHTAEWLVGVVTSTGFLAILKSVLTIVRRIRSGQKVREPARREQIVSERDEAAAREAAERERADRADERAAAAIRYASRLREYCVAHGTRPADLPHWPHLLKEPA